MTEMASGSKDGEVAVNPPAERRRGPRLKETDVDRRTKAWRMLAAGVDNPAAAGTDANTEVFQGVRFNYVGEARCKICTAEDPAKALPHGALVRSTVDDLLVRGATYSSVLAAIEPLVADWPTSRRPSYASVRRHALRHLRADAAAVGTILERRAQEADVMVTVGTGPIVTMAGLLETIRQKGFEAIATGMVVPRVRDTLEAAFALEDLDRDDRLATLAEVMGQVREFADAVRNSVGDDIFQSILSLADRPALAESSADSPIADKGEPDNRLPGAEERTATRRHRG
jgi:hypothetical protein